MNEDLTDAKVINSGIYGEIKVLPEQIFHFPKGIVGFESLTKFALLQVEDTELYSFHAFEDELGLLLFPSALSDNHIEFELDEETVKQLDVTSANELIIYYILRIIDEKPYINQKAPIIISPDSKRGCQYVIQSESVNVRELLVIKGE